LGARSAPQVLIIAGITRCFDTADKSNRDANSPSPAGCAANRALVETLDKTALLAAVTLRASRESQIACEAASSRHAVI